MRVALGSDHAGYPLKQRLIAELERLGHAVEDLGTFAAEPPVDYPDFCFPVAERVAGGRADRGIVLGGSGIGEAIAANKVKGIRASVVTSDETARLTRLHNDSNVLALGARTNAHEDAVRWLGIWLATPFEGGRHVARLQKIAAYESSHFLRK
ncbi:MAG: ribose 5-phosphate isomerase B [Candidatus Eisenbacteria bacterium]|uniref:Ribose 5-phosphate isomerase B n=1 Tax=Eiseniibacteriota bacterium TaxID=2212470 RepID=A0A9D6QM03_UNCEI|nr:ribose 5-phosphate isomerase B [Candidatus Eisenbacteria bacterium]MBI3539228.1 ribose 5-phosphate isomerase B [Candidatus Eisenbacteria bacterium]